MERKLELKDICGYIPHDLYFYYTEKEAKIDRINKFPIESYHRLFGGNLIALNKPILRPLSDISKPIIHNGKEEVPIVELAKIGLPHHSEKEWRLERNIHDMTVAKYGDMEFMYMGVLGYFSAWDCGRNMPVNNSYQLFDYLHSRFIDYRGLINAGLAISVYDLPENPYK